MRRSISSIDRVRLKSSLVKEICSAVVASMIELNNPVCTADGTDRQVVERVLKCFGVTTMKIFVRKLDSTVPLLQKSLSTKRSFRFVRLVGLEIMKQSFLGIF